MFWYGLDEPEKCNVQNGPRYLIGTHTAPFRDDRTVCCIESVVWVRKIVQEFLEWDEEYIGRLCLQRRPEMREISFLIVGEQEHSGSVQRGTRCIHHNLRMSQEV